MMRLPADIYQQFDADSSQAVPGEAFGGWKKAEIEINPAKTALVVMHAWDTGQPDEYPGWRRCVEYMPRAKGILANVFPRLLGAVRQSPMPIFHVVGGRDYYRHLPGYQRILELQKGQQAEDNGCLPQRNTVEPDAVYQRLKELRQAKSHPGNHNLADVEAGFARLDFAEEACPMGDEGIAENGEQLAVLCRAHGINHLVYVGFAINWCLLMSPGGMVDMERHGCICSTIREAVTAVENRETARLEMEKSQALWRVAIAFGFIFSLEDFIRNLPQTR